MQVNPYESPPVPRPDCGGSLQDGRWSLTLTGFFAGGYVGAWVGSLAGAGVGVLLAMLAGRDSSGYGNQAAFVVESLVTTGLLVAIMGTISGVGVGSTLGILLGLLVAATGNTLRKSFLGLSCVAGCFAAMVLAAVMLRFDSREGEFRAVGGTHAELLAQATAMGVVGLAGLTGVDYSDGFCEVAWERGAQVEVVAEANRPTMN